MATRLIYPLVLKDLINDNEIKAPFVKLIPKTSRIRKTNETFDVEIEQDGQTKKTSVPKQKQEAPIKLLKYEDQEVNEIILPMPPNIVNSISGNFQSVEGLGMLAGGDIGKYVKWKMTKAAMALTNALPQEVVMAIKSGIFGGAIDNPHEKTLYAGQNKRSFTLTYENIIPTSAQEETEIRNIINAFLFCSVGEYTQWIIKAPPSFDVEFHSTPGNIILSYNNCKISGLEETMGGIGESFASMESSWPIFNISVTFNEMDFVTANNLLRN